MTSKFCTTADVLPLINGNPAFVDASRDAKIEAQIKAATALIRTFTRREWDSRQHTEYFSVPDIDVLRGIGSTPLQFRLSHFPVATPLSAVVKYSPTGQWSLVEAEPTDRYAFEQVELGKGMISMYSSEIQSSTRSVQIVYTAGFQVDGSDDELLLVDQNLKSACAMQAAFMYRRQLEAEQGKSSKGNRSGQAQFNIRPTGLIAEAQALIRSYVMIFTGR